MNYLAMCKTPGEKFLLAAQLPLLFLESKLSGKKLFELDLVVPLSGSKKFLSFLLKHPDSYVPSWFKEIDFPNGVFLDIGSNLGFYGAYFFSKTGMPVIAFEINPKTSSLLSKAVSEPFFAQKFSVQSYGLSDKEGVVELFSDSDFSPLTTASEQSMKMSEEEHGKKFTLKSKAQVKTLDSVLESGAFDTYLKGTKIGAMKIDVEGLDKQVLLGALKTIKAHSPLLVIESNSDAAKNEVIELLEKQNYSIEPLNRNNLLAKPL